MARQATTSVRYESGTAASLSTADSPAGETRGGWRARSCRSAIAIARGFMPSSTQCVTRARNVGRASKRRFAAKVSAARLIWDHTHGAAIYTHRLDMQRQVEDIKDEVPQQQVHGDGQRPPRPAVLRDIVVGEHDAPAEVTGVGAHGTEV